MGKKGNQCQNHYVNFFDNCIKVKGTRFMENIIPKKQRKKLVRKRSLIIKKSEAEIQESCIKWFRLQYPCLSVMLFAVPNGEERNIITATKLKRQGVIRGVADLILLVPKKGYASLCIEMKTPKGIQSEHQRTWQRAAEQYRNRYVVCRSLEEFMNEVNSYLL